MKREPSDFMRKHTYGRLKANPPKARTATSGGLGRPLRLTFIGRGRRRVTVKFTGEHRADFTPTTVTIHGPDLSPLAQHLPGRPTHIVYQHAASGLYRHEFKRSARVSLDRAALRIANVHVKPFIEG